MADTFALLFRRKLAEKALSQRAFAALVNAKQAQISQVVRGKKPPPLSRLDLWADTLGIHALERFDFELAALLDHAPAELAVIVGRLADENRRLQGKASKSGGIIGASTTARSTRPRRRKR